MTQCQLTCTVEILTDFSEVDESLFDKRVTSLALEGAE